MACILIDVGNTSTTIGRWEDGKVKDLSIVKGGVKDPLLAEQALILSGVKQCDAAFMASVVPAQNDTWVWLLKKIFNLDLQILTSKTKMPIGIDYPNPEQIGADRLADAVGAFARYGKPVMVADFGTALTFDVVNENGDYIGGVIAPGLPLMTDYLHERTAKLPKIELKTELPEKCNSTEDAMRIGAKIGHRGMVREIASYLRSKMADQNVVLCATGGYAEWALEGLDMECHIDNDLTLFGLGVIYEYSFK